MKIRNGFVSNSSSSSFCLFGWKVKEGQEWNDEVKNIVRFLETIHPTHHWGNIYRIEHDRNDDYFVGVGTAATDIDHYDDDWEEYRSPMPEKEYCEKLKENQKQIEEMFKDFIEPGLQYFSDTFRD